jgi:glyoxylase-like metal-dependent hydrolase (beta-lactamase superfamily II)
MTLTTPAPGACVEVVPGVLWIRLPLPMALNHVNVWALADGEGWTIVDTGLRSEQTASMWESLLAGPLGGRTGSESWLRTCTRIMSAWPDG